LELRGTDRFIFIVFTNNVIFITASSLEPAAQRGFPRTYTLRRCMQR
jgi:hypothetical protein